MMLSTKMHCVDCGSVWPHPFVIPSRREQRRSRKAKKNLVMYKTEGRRPWSADSWDGTHNSLGDKLLCQRDRHGGRACRGIDDWCMCDGEQRSMHAERMEHLRERSGFLDMSRRADEAAFLRDHLAEFNRLSMSTLFDEAMP